ncbi:MAG: ribonuclease H-like domain-containing protein [Aigarchaeota archaeon]|nr:ribonuclease H-like domain-containing protein [Candidatus Geocrenenecus dongiae]
MSKNRIRKIKPRVCFMDLEATALDGDVGILVGAGFMDEDGKFKWFYVENPSEEKEVIKTILDYVSRYHIVVTWNGSRFDIPFLTARALKHKLKVELIYKPTHLDLAEFTRNNVKLSFTTLYHVARFLGIQKDLSTEGIDVPSLYLKAVNGDRHAASIIKKHCRDDLEVLRKVYLRIFPILRELRSDLVL